MLNRCLDDIEWFEKNFRKSFRFSTDELDNKQSEFYNNKIIDEIVSFLFNNNNIFILNRSVYNDFNKHNSYLHCRNYFR